MDYPQAMLLAVVQGVTEWLPVSSSGHLAAAQMLMGLEVPVAYDVVLHLGTLMAVLVFLRKELCEMAASVVRREFRGVSFRLLALVALGSIPAGVIGLLFKKPLESLFTNLPAVTAAFALTGVILLSSRRHDRPRELDARVALAVGAMQAAAIIPGVSRSGSTISAALILGLSPENAAKYSFLLSIPAILGAGLLEAGSLMSSGLPAVMILSGFAVSAAVGWASINVLWRVIAAGRLHMFAYYCFALAITLAALQLL